MTGRTLARAAAAAAVCVVLTAGCTAHPAAQVSPARGAARSSATTVASTTVRPADASTFRPAPSSDAKPAISPTGRTASAGPGPVVVMAASTDTPQGAAVAWVTALRTAGFRDSPTAWVSAIAPYVTPELEASYRSLGGGGMSGGQGWASFVLDGCVSAVVGPAGVIPPEAPASPVAAHVQVSATLTTACRTGRVSNEFIAATVLVTKAAGRWAVAAREF